jgi:hypothetical protein
VAMKNKSAFKRNISAQKARDILAKKGVSVSEKKADEILEIMYFLAKLIVNQNVK